jgi:hypothetical protein
MAQVLHVVLGMDKYEENFINSLQKCTWSSLYDRSYSQKVLIGALSALIDKRIKEYILLPVDKRTKVDE